MTTATTITILLAPHVIIRAHLCNTPVKRSSHYIASHPEVYTPQALLLPSSRLPSSSHYLVASSALILDSPVNSPAPCYHRHCQLTLAHCLSQTIQFGVGSYHPLPCLAALSSLSPAVGE